jgi:mannose-6-phosphate isomerase-like protein (cupin superfamily)
LLFCPTPMQQLSSQKADEPTTQRSRRPAVPFLCPEYERMNPVKPIGGPTRPHFNLSEAVEYRQDAFVRKRLFEVDSLHFNVYCIVPGQENPLHRHPSSDEVLYFVHGTGECVVGDAVYAVKPGDLVLAPRDAAHGVRNTGKEDLVCILAQSPLPCEHVPVRD